MSWDQSSAALDEASCGWVQPEKPLSRGTDCQKPGTNNKEQESKEMGERHMKSCVQILTQYPTAMKVPLKDPRRVWGSAGHHHIWVKVKSP